MKWTPVLTVHGQHNVFAGQAAIGSEAAFQHLAPTDR